MRKHKLLSHTNNSFNKHLLSFTKSMMSFMKPLLSFTTCLLSFTKYQVLVAVDQTKSSDQLLGTKRKKSFVGNLLQKLGEKERLPVQSFHIFSPWDKLKPTKKGFLLLKKVRCDEKASFLPFLILLKSIEGGAKNCIEMKNCFEQKLLRSGARREKMRYCEFGQLLWYSSFCSLQ